MTSLVQMQGGSTADKQVLQSTYGALFFGVPNQGMDINSLLPMAESQPNLGFLLSLGPNSDSLRNLHRSFCKAFPFQDSEIISFFETEETRTAKLVGSLRSSLAANSIN
jgi:hypothetical protein